MIIEVINYLMVIMDQSFQQNNGKHGKYNLKPHKIIDIN